MDIELTILEKLLNDKVPFAAVCSRISARFEVDGLGLPVTYVAHKSDTIRKGYKFLDSDDIDSLTERDLTGEEKLEFNINKEKYFTMHLSTDDGIVYELKDNPFHTYFKNKPRFVKPTRSKEPKVIAPEILEENKRELDALTELLKEPQADKTIMSRYIALNKKLNPKQIPTIPNKLTPVLNK